MSNPFDEMQASLGHYFGGMKRVDEKGLAQLATFTDWARIAQQEIERRATRIVEALDDETLAAIANGQIDVPSVIRKTLNNNAG